MPQFPPMPDPQSGLLALQAMLRKRHPLAAMQVFHTRLGDVFQINLPGFKPIVMAGPDAARFVLVSERDNLRWRNESDPVTDLLGHGVLVEDGASHDTLRALMNPSMHRTMLETYVQAMQTRTDQILDSWVDNGTVDMLVEMRKIALLILVDTLFGADFTPHMQRLWAAVLGVIRYISPGLWMLWTGVPHLEFKRAIRQIDAYLYRLIDARRTQISDGEALHDLLGALLAAGLEDDLIRDQLLTMLIAGHDTSTALLAWALMLLGQHPESLAQAQAEVDAVLMGSTPDMAAIHQLDYLGRVIKEALRLYPPIHLGSRLAAQDITYQDFLIPAGTRVIYSIYLTQRHPACWPDPNTYNPDRYNTARRDPPYTWLAFGGGPRNCIGGAFGQIESKVVLARILQRFDLQLLPHRIYPHMGATLEPRPGIPMRIAHRRL
jgi:cytochrome P450